MARGLVKWFNDAKGYGFITCDDGRELFVHYADIPADGFRTLARGQVIEFDERQAPQGPRAINVRI
ncbi:MAG TPA: cold shock domain-containing protein [Kofleriaceae bacterium]|nr:cold shock domain-containing protein [Kofleriaceae bacterium]